MDLLIRTSGEHRLSDFLLWQSSCAQLVFSDTLWPDYSFWNLLQALVQYQRSYPELRKLQDAHQKAVAHANGIGVECGIQCGLKGSSLLRQSSSQAHETSEAEACPAAIDIAADTHLESIENVAKANTHSLSADSLREATDVDTSDSSASSESRTASPTHSPVRPWSISPETHEDMEAGSMWHQKSSMQASQEFCGGSPGRPSDSKQAQNPSLTHVHGSNAALDSNAYNGNKLSPCTLHADVDCRTTSSPSLSRRNSHRKPRDSTVTYRQT